MKKRICFWLSCFLVVITLLTLAACGNRGGTKYPEVDTSDLGDKLYSFGALSDVHIGADTSEGDLRRALNYFQDEARVDFVCIAGDLTNAGLTEEWALYNDCIADESEKTPVYAIAGNHDALGEGLSDALFETYTGHKLFYTFTQGDDVFIMLSQLAWPSRSGNIHPFADASLQQLYETLEANRNKRCFVFIHPFVWGGSGDPFELYSSDALWGDQGEVIKGLMAHYPNALWFHGHSHQKFEVRDLHEKAYYDNDQGCHSIHIPSCASPVGVVDGQLVEYTDGSQGYVIDVYETAVVLRGRDFISGEFLPCAALRLDTPLQTVAKGTFSDSTGIIDVEVDVPDPPETGSDDTNDETNTSGSADTPWYENVDIPYTEVQAPDPDTMLYSFGALSDVHVSVDTAADDFRRALSYFQDTAQVDFVCIAGDLTQYSEASEWALYQQCIAEAGAHTPVYAVSGNHDAYAGGLSDAELREYIGQSSFYTFTHGDDVFIFMSSLSWPSESREVQPFSDKMLQKLYETLEANYGKRCFVFQHYFVSGNSGDPLGAYDSNAFFGSQGEVIKSMMAHYPNAIWFHGHSHHMFEMQALHEAANYDFTYGCHSVHIPSCATPIAIVDGERVDVPEESQGYLVEVYENSVLLKGRDFAEGEFLPFATYLLDTTIKTVERGTYVDPTGTIDTSVDIDYPIIYEEVTPPDPDTRLYSFGALSDIHISRETAEEDFRRALRYFQDEAAVDFVCIAGDLTQKNQVSEWELFASCVAEESARTPVYAIGGDNDTLATGLSDAILEKYVGQKLFHTFTQGDDVFIMVSQFTFPSRSGNLQPYYYLTLQALYEALEENRDKRCFVFMYPFVQGQSGDPLGLCSADALWGSQGEVIISLMEHYPNAIWFHGRSHYAFEVVGKDETANYDNALGCHSVHIPSCSVPVLIKQGERVEVPEGSQGYVVEVYKDSVLLKGRDFVTGEFLPYATYLLDTTLKTVEAGTYVDTTGTIDVRTAD